jgi:hypothetical protein
MSRNPPIRRHGRRKRLKNLFPNTGIPVMTRQFGGAGRTNARVCSEHICWASGLATFSMVNKVTPRWPLPNRESQDYHHRRAAVRTQPGGWLRQWLRGLRLFCWSLAG